jgi:hypothetical protein
MESFAPLIGIGESRLGQIETGVRLPKLRELLLVSLVLGCKLKDLLRE